MWTRTYAPYHCVKWRKFVCYLYNQSLPLLHQWLPLSEIHDLLLLHTVFRLCSAVSTVICYFILLFSAAEPYHLKALCRNIHAALCPTPVRISYVLLYTRTVILYNVKIMLCYLIHFPVLNLRVRAGGIMIRHSILPKWCGFVLLRLLFLFAYLYTYISCGILNDIQIQIICRMYITK
jgi:hypothetical protein